MSENEILILQFVAQILSHIWSYYAGFVIFGLPLTSIFSALLCISIILPLLYTFTSYSVSSTLGGSLTTLNNSTKEHEIAMRRKK